MRITSSVTVSDLGSDNPPASEEGPGLLDDGDDADSVSLLNDALGLHSLINSSFRVIPPECDSSIR